MESSDLLVNLVVALVAGLTGALIAARLKQSVILGYILAGIAIGPHTPGFVGDVETVEALAEIGIILLMFAIGIQFSLGDLRRAGMVAFAGSTIQVLLMIGIGTAAGLAFGWEPLEALFFGAVVSNSSSTVLSKVLGERGELDSPHGRLALAWSTFQDLGTVILIVLLSALATDSDSLVRDTAIEVGKAGVFLLVLLPIGTRVLPWLLAHVAQLRNREVFVLTVAVLALGVSYAASLSGLSLALGAFVAGVVVGESDLSHQVLGEVLPLRDIFAGLFFVSVGMLVDPDFVLHNLPLLTVTLVLIVAVKSVLVALPAALLGTPTRVAVLTGAALAQSAEFSFLLAQVGRDLEAISSESFALMLAGAAGSIVLLPAVFASSHPLSVTLGERRASLRGETRAGEADHVGMLSGHAIIAGYGRVGEVIARVVGQRFPIVAIEEDVRIAERLRAEGIRVVQGSASTAAVFEQAQPARASVLVIAIPDPVAVRQLVDYVEETYPSLDTVVRTHSAEERRFLMQRGVDEVVLGEWELALEMLRHTLGSFGVENDDIQGILAELRASVDLEPRDAILRLSERMHERARS